MHEIRLEKTTDTGHRIVGHEGKCARLHGHTYRWIVTCQSRTLNTLGFVVDFGHIKDELDLWDHRTVLWSEDPIAITLGSPPILKLNRQVTEAEMTSIKHDFQEAMRTQKPIILGEGMTLVNMADQELGIVRVDFNPTAENMCADMARRIGLLLPPSSTCTVEVYETPSGSAKTTWRGPHA